MFERPVVRSNERCLLVWHHFMRDHCQGKLKSASAANARDFIVCCFSQLQIEADPDILPRTNSFGLDYLLLTNLCPTNTPPAWLRLTFYCCIYDPRSRPTFVEITQKLELLLEKYDCIPKVSDTSYNKSCGNSSTADDLKNGKKSSSSSSSVTSQAIANKRYSIDNYCSNWLSNACKPTHNEPTDLLHNNVSEKIQSSSASSSMQIAEKAAVAAAAAAATIAANFAANGHERQQMRILEANKLLHRRSLSENIIPFPPHTTPSDKARCHLINRRNSQLNASSGRLCSKLF